jgi:hypothetical protein
VTASTSTANCRPTRPARRSLTCWWQATLMAPVLTNGSRGRAKRTLAWSVNTPIFLSEASVGAKAMKISVSAIFAVTIFGATAPSASAHDWYPHECCHDKDCAPVESMTLITPAGGGAPYMVVASKHGKAILRRDFPTRESKDSRMHVCLGQYDTGEKEVICIFIPPGT